MDVAAVLWNGQQGVILERTSAELSPKGANTSDVTLDSLNSEQAVPCIFLKLLSKPKGCFLVLHGIANARCCGCYFPYNPQPSGNLTNNLEM